MCLLPSSPKIISSTPQLLKINSPSPQIPKTPGGISSLLYTFHAARVFTIQSQNVSKQLVEGFNPVNARLQRALIPAPDIIWCFSYRGIFKQTPSLFADNVFPERALMGMKRWNLSEASLWNLRGITLLAWCYV